MLCFEGMGCLIMSAKGFIKCKYCGVFISPKHIGPCPKCGKKEKVYYENLVVNMTSYTRLKGKVRESIGKKPYLEFYSGTKTSGDTRYPSGVKEQMIFDRKNNNKYHKVVDLETGKVIHYENKPLKINKNNTEDKEQ